MTEKHNNDNNKKPPRRCVCRLCKHATRSRQPRQHNEARENRRNVRMRQRRRWLICARCSNEHEAPSSSIFNISGRGKQNSTQARTHTRSGGPCLPACLPGSGHQQAADSPQCIPDTASSGRGGAATAVRSATNQRGDQEREIGIKQIPGPRLVPGPPM